MDDTVDIIEEMPASWSSASSSIRTRRRGKSVNEILKYPEDSAGSIMTTEFVDLKRDMTVEDAFKRIRRNRRGQGDHQHLLRHRHQPPPAGPGVHPHPSPGRMRRIIIEDIMETNVIFATTLEDKEDVAQDLSKYDFLAMPVVDKEGRLVGIVTIDDAIGRHGGGGHRDFELMAAITPHGQALPPHRGDGDGAQPPALADAADALRHPLRAGHQQLRGVPGHLFGAHRIHSHAHRHRQATAGPRAPWR